MPTPQASTNHLQGRRHLSQKHERYIVVKGRDRTLPPSPAVGLLNALGIVVGGGLGGYVFVLNKNKEVSRTVTNFTYQIVMKYLIRVSI